MRFQLTVLSLVIGVTIAASSPTTFAQQRAVKDFIPTIAHPTHAPNSGPSVWIDQAHHNFHTLDGRYQSFAKFLERDGYQLAANTQPFTKGSLVNCDVLVIANALHASNNGVWKLPTASAFTDDEITALSDWVNNGGSLMLIADHMPFPGAAAKLAAAFGFTFNNGYTFGPNRKSLAPFTHNDQGPTLTDHPITRNINSIKTFTGQAFTSPPHALPLMILPSGAQTLMVERAGQIKEDTPRIDSAGMHQGAVLQFGQGRIAVFGEAAMFTAQISAAGSPMGMNAPDAKGNATFLLNSLRWLTTTAAIGLTDTSPSTSNWPSFRGTGATGLAPLAPTNWDVPNDKNVLWQTSIEGLGHSSPIIWGDKLFVTTAVTSKADAELKLGLYGNIEPVQDDTPHRYLVICLDKNTGKILWQHQAFKGVPAVKRHTKATHANSTPVTNGKRIVALFGSEGLYCYTMDGELLWKKDLGVLDAGYFRVPTAQWEYASSPIIFEDKIIVQADIQKESFLAAFSLEDGRELWRTPREDVPTWGTPTIVNTHGRDTVVINGWKRMGAYDAQTGAPIWWMVGGGDIPVPTPFVAHDLIYIANAHGKLSPIYAIRPDSKGDITPARNATSSEGVAWADLRAGSYLITPIVIGDYIYLCKGNGVLQCLNAKTGAEIYKQRLGSGKTGFTASLIGTPNHLYVTSETGTVYVIKPGPDFELISENPIGESCMATPAISAGVMFIRTINKVIAVSPPLH